MRCLSDSRSLTYALSLVFLFLVVPVYAEVCYAPEGHGCHYVSPLGNADWASCLDNSTTCNMTVALDEAQAGEVVFMMAGTYTREGTGNVNLPAFNPSNSGSTGLPIVFDAIGDVEITLSSGYGPVIGANNRDFIRWTGMRVREGEGAPAHNFDYGVVSFEVADHCVIESATIIGRGRDLPDNHDGVRIEGATGTIVRNNTISGIINLESSNPNHANHAGVKLYGSDSSVIENNLFTNSSTGIFDKRNGWNNTVRYNLFEGLIVGYKMYSGDAPLATALDLWKNG